MVEKKKRGQLLTAEDKIEIFEKLKSLAMSGTLHGYSIQHLSEMFGINRATMKKQLDTFYSMIKEEDVDIVYIDFRILFDRLFRESYKVLNEAHGPQEKEKGVRLVADMIEKKTTFMERFGKKEKVADKVDVSIEKQLVIDNVLEDNIQDGEVSEVE